MDKTPIDESDVAGISNAPCGSAAVFEWNAVSIMFSIDSKPANCVSNFRSTIEPTMNALQIEIMRSSWHADQRTHFEHRLAFTF